MGSDVPPGGQQGPPAREGWRATVKLVVGVCCLVWGWRATDPVVAGDAPPDLSPLAWYLGCAAAVLGFLLLIDRIRPLRGGGQRALPPGPSQR
jgi:hypothetical protein